MGCGVCGFVGLSDKQLLRSMSESISHRGPDSTGFYLDDGVGLGIDRLKIIDLSTGDQPIHNEDESVWLVFNGEIYNYVELRRDLEAAGGHRFYTSSDTEVIVHAYEEWKEEGCLRRLRGMFAFALWDRRSRSLFLARDRFGKKPLYYSKIGGVLLFGSELKAILSWDQVPRRLDAESVDRFFTYMYVPSPATIFRDVRKLPPGSYAVYKGGDLAVRRYWDMTFRPDQTLTEDAIVNELYSTISEAVRIRLRSDVPLGAFLSGGIDSSVVVSMMSRLSDQPVKTVSIGFEEGTSEVRYSRMMADFLKTDHTEHTVAPPSAFDVLPRLIRHFDEPFADHSMMPTYFLSEVTREKVTVALSGDGGDELFMGYPFLNDPASFGLYSAIPGGVRRPILRSISKLPLSSSARRMANHAYEKDYGGQPPAQRYAMRMAMLDTASLRGLYSESFNKAHLVSDAYGYLVDLVNSSQAPDTIDRLDYATIKGYLEEGILTKVDRMSMAVSLEVRCPLLDHELAELVGTIPSRFKMRGRQTKYIFKKMAVQKELVPREIAYRRKQGFGAPLESWSKGSWRDLMSQALDPVVSNNYTGLFDGATVKKFLGDPYLYSNRLFALTVFVYWYRMYIEEQGEKAVTGASRLS
ncbi:MAG TPA: asparagine synthase (glutamine-hydrolyzing) [Nitrososphaerales archaeon]|nr:asparagine synthase (glutamine-hydrolyzing) [Nitrososphaerales archaeon]